MVPPLISFVLVFTNPLNKLHSNIVKSAFAMYLSLNEAHIFIGNLNKVFFFHLLALFLATYHRVQI